MPDAFRQLKDHMLRKDGGDREMVDILSLVLQHNEADVLCAVEQALEAGVPTKTHILNLLHRLLKVTLRGICFVCHNCNLLSIDPLKLLCLC